MPCSGWKWQKPNWKLPRSIGDFGTWNPSKGWTTIGKAASQAHPMGLMNHWKQDHCSAVSVPLQVLASLSRDGQVYSMWQENMAITGVDFFKSQLYQLERGRLLASEWPNLGQVPIPPIDCGLRPKKHLAALVEMLWMELGKEQWPEERVLGETDPLYNGLICHAQPWSSYPDIAAKRVSWTLVRLRLWHVGPKCSLCSNSHSLSHLSGVSPPWSCPSLSTPELSAFFFVPHLIYTYVPTHVIYLRACVSVNAVNIWGRRLWVPGNWHVHST